MTKDDNKIVRAFLDTIKTSNKVSRSDVLSLEEQIPGIISEELPVNSFTAMSTSTNVGTLISHLDNTISNEDNEKPINILDLIALANETKMKVNRRIDSLKNFTRESNIELYDLCKNKHFISYYVTNDEKKELINPLEYTPYKFIFELHEYEETLIGSRDKASTDQIVAISNDIRSKLSNNELKVFPIINQLLSNNVKLFPSTVDFKEYTIDDILKDVIFTNVVLDSLKELVVDLTKFTQDLIFDDTYDNNMNRTSYSYEYKRSADKLKDVASLMDDDYGFAILNLLKIYFIK